MGFDTKNLEAWLKLTMEEPIDPDLPICDPHHHLWDDRGDRGRYLLDEYLTDADGGHNIIRTVFIECGTGYRQDGPEEMRPVGETEFACRESGQGSMEKSRQTSVAEGIVAFADLFLGAAVARVIEAHAGAAGNRLKGIRHLCIWDIDPAVITRGNARGMMMESEFRKGFACLRNYGLVFDAWQYYTQLMELKDLAEKFPDTTIVVNHTGGPLGVGWYKGRHEEVFRDWKKNIAELAKCPNVFMKLGGLGMPRCGFGWHERPRPPDSMELAAAMTPYFDFCMEKFGIYRCMFESNFPVDKVSCSYTVLWNAFKGITMGFSPDERAALFHDNAVRVYRLSEKRTNINQNID
jgi:L-fuconolactonase